LAMTYNTPIRQGLQAENAIPQKSF
jgi:hypothetical protein